MKPSARNKSENEHGQYADLELEPPPTVIGCEQSWNFSFLSSSLQNFSRSDAGSTTAACTPFGFDVDREA